MDFSHIEVPTTYLKTCCQHELFYFSKIVVPMSQCISSHDQIDNRAYVIRQHGYESTQFDAPHDILSIHIILENLSKGRKWVVGNYCCSICGSLNTHIGVQYLALKILCHKERVQSMFLSILWLLPWGTFILSLRCHAMGTEQKFPERRIGGKPPPVV